MNKVSLAAVSSVVLLALVVSTLTLTFSAEAQGTNVPNKLLKAQSYVLNILGKKSDYNGDPSYESTDRHTMFVPENVTEFLDGSTFADCKIWVTQGLDFAVEDPNMFDDGRCNLTIGPGKYEVYFVALGKPGSTAILEGWIYNVTANDYLLYIGSVSVSHSKKPVWQSGHDMFYVSVSEAASIGVTIEDEMWIFDFLDLLETNYLGTDYLYLWKLVSGCKHIQVRFYKVG